jgi:hypothetical protein
MTLGNFGPGASLPRGFIVSKTRRGDALTNEEIARRFVVGNMNGMRRNTKRNLLVLISDPFKGLSPPQSD